MMAIYDEELMQVLRSISERLPLYNSLGSRPKSESSSGGAINAAERSLRILHGTTDDLVTALRSLANLTAFGGVIAFAISEARHLTSSFNKLADVGQMFHGSIFEMASRAGEAGLSLDQFGKMMTQGSLVAATMRTQSETAFIDLNKGVRQSLQAFGMYGMSLTEVTDSTVNLMEMYRQTGLLYYSNTTQQKGMVLEMVRDVTLFSEATGRSRQEILKVASDMARTSGALGMLNASNASQQAITAFTKVNTFLNSMPKSFAPMATMFNQIMLGTIGPLTPFGQTLIKVGLSPIVTSISDFAAKVKSGVEPTTEEMTSLVETVGATIQGNVGALRGLASLEPAAIAQLMEIFGDLNPQLRANLAKVLKEQEVSWKDPLSRFALNFESVLHEVTGEYQKTFYKALIRPFWTAGAPANREEAARQEEEMKDRFKKAASEIGEALGKAAGILLEAGPAFAHVIPVLASGFAWLAKQLSWLIDAISNLFKGKLGDGAADMLAIGIPFLGLMIGKKILWAITGALVGGIPGAVAATGGGILASTIAPLIGRALGGVFASFFAVLLNPVVWIPLLVAAGVGALIGIEYLKNNTLPALEERLKVLEQQEKALEDAANRVPGVGEVDEYGNNINQFWYEQNKKERAHVKEKIDKMKAEINKAKADQPNDPNSWTNVETGAVLTDPARIKLLDNQRLHQLTSERLVETNARLAEDEAAKAAGANRDVEIIELTKQQVALQVTIKNLMETNVENQAKLLRQQH